MSQIRKWLWTALLLMSILSCQKIEFRAAVQNPIMPIELGRFWEYEVVFTERENGILVDSCTQHLVWEIVEKGYLDQIDPENANRELRFETFLLRSHSEFGEFEYLIRPEATGILIFEIRKQSDWQYDDTFQCYGDSLLDFQYLIQYPFPDSINLPQNIVVGCGMNDCHEKAIKGVQSLGPRILLPDSLVPIIVQGNSYSANKVGNEYWMPNLGLLGMDLNWSNSNSSGNFIDHFSWRLTAFGLRN